MKKLAEALKMLRQDAIDRGMPELAIAYGWSAIRAYNEVLDAQTAELKSWIK